MQHEFVHVGLNYMGYDPDIYINAHEVAAYGVTINQLAKFGCDLTDAIRIRNTYKDNLPMYSPNLSNKVQVQYINKVKW